MAIVVEVNTNLLNETTEETYKQNEEHVDWTAAGFHLTWASHQLTCWQSVIVPASRCVSCSSSALACCRL